MAQKYLLSRIIVTWIKVKVTLSSFKMQSSPLSIIMPSLNEKGSYTFKYTPTSKVFNAVSKTAAVFLDYANITQNQYKNVQLELLQCLTKFHPVQLEIIKENESKSFCFAPILWAPVEVKVNGSSIKWKVSMVPMNMVRRERIWLKSCA